MSCMPVVPENVTIVYVLKDLNWNWKLFQIKKMMYHYRDMEKYRLKPLILRV